MPITNSITSSLVSWLNTILASRKLPRPGIINIEPVSNLCQLKCPLCPTGINLLDYPPKVMPIDTFKAILDKVPFIGVLELYRSGEPFLNPDLFAMIRYARDRNIKVVISSHFSFSKPDDFFENIVTSGLEKLYISLDGASQETYSNYRVGGDYDLVMANITALIEAKKRLRRGKPEIIWQFLVNKFNEHEIETARKIAKDLNIEIDFRPLDLDDELPDVTLAETIEERMTNWLPRNEKLIAERYLRERRNPLFPGVCKDLFTRMIVTVDGKVMPCCMVWDHNNAFGDLLTDSFDEIWYSRKYLDARSRFLIEDHRPQIQSICFRCNNFGITPSFRDKLKLLLAVYRKSLSLLGKKSLMKNFGK
jgi:MoaA/NifB/PqqE/SkfB family radical SAM enzyme